jgi:sRNA-binding carbon storage regulator CsrA
MALVLGVVEGARIYIDDTPLDVLKISKTSISVEVSGVGYILSQNESVEVYPKVFVSVGVSKKRDVALPRLLFEAPRDIAINRRELYEQRKQKVPHIP